MLIQAMTKKPKIRVIRHEEKEGKTLRSTVIFKGSGKAFEFWQTMHGMKPTDEIQRHGCPQKQNE